MVPISPRSDLSPASNIASDASRWNSSNKSALAADAAQRLPPYRERLGAAFAFEGEIAAKRQELDEINASLAANNAGEEQVAA